MSFESPLFLMVMVLIWNLVDDPDVNTKDLMFREQTIVQVVWNDSGKLALSSRTFYNVELSRHATLIHQPEIQKELELTDSQIRDIDQLFDQAYKSSAKLREKYPKLLSDPISWPAYQQLYDQNNQRMSEILIPAQQERLDQIFLRIEWRKNGVAEFFREYAESLEMNLGDRQVENLKQIIRQFQANKVAELTARCEKRYAEVFEVLDRRQRQVLDEYQAQQTAQTTVDIIAAQLQYALDLEEMDWNNESLEAASDFLAKTPEFRMYQDGRFETLPEASSIASYWALKLSNDFSAEPFSVARPGRLPIDPVDLAAVQQIHQEFTEQRDDEHKEYREAIRGVTDFERQAISKAYQDRRKMRVEKLLDSFFSSLSPESDRNLTGFFVRESSRNYGPVAMILVGPLGVQLEVSDQQKEAIRKATEKALSEIGNELAEAEEELLKDVNGVIGPENEKKLNEALGPRLQHVKPNLTVLTQ